MKNLIRLFLLGIPIGLVTGWVMSQQKQAREAQVERDDFESDADVIALRQAWKREKRIDQWLNELEEK